MNKILTRQEAFDIATQMMKSYGFTGEIDLQWSDAAEPCKTASLCNVFRSIETTGYWFWKKEITVTEFKPVCYGSNFEEVLEALEKNLLGENGQGRVDKANRFRDKCAALMLDEKLEEEDS